MPTVCCGRTAHLETDTPWDGQGYPATALLSKPPGIHLLEIAHPLGSGPRPHGCTHQGKQRHTLLWGQTQGTAPDSNPTVCGKSKGSHSRIRSRTDFSIKLRGRLTCSCFTGLLTVLSPTESQPEQRGALGTGEPALQELNSLLDFRPAIFFFLSLIYHTAGLQTHPSLRMLHLPHPHQAGVGLAGVVTHTQPHAPSEKENPT